LYLHCHTWHVRSCRAATKTRRVSGF
jgi:hypothetical protein